ncbi:MAG: hypothetical protein ACRD5I_02700 [Candidatus Acidiferrales bacterium]
MRAAILFLTLLALSACAGTSGDTGVVVPSCSGAPILTPSQIDFVRTQFALFQPELYCAGTNPREVFRLRPDNYTPARFFGNNRASTEQVTPLGIRFQSSGFDSEDIPVALPQQIDYFDFLGQPFSRQLPVDESGRLIRVTPDEIDDIFLDVKEYLRVQYPQFPEMQLVSSASITVRFQAAVFYVEPNDVWAGGVTSTDGKAIEVAIFHLSPREKIPISWRGISGVSQSWLFHEIRNAIFIQSGHPEFAS